MDPYRQDCSLLIAPAPRSVCTMRALRKYLSLRFVSGASPLYVFQSGAYLTRAKVTSILRALHQRLSLPTELYASHSFMIGAALQHPKLACHLGLSKHWDADQATASPSISELHLLSFRRFLGCWLRHTLQERGSATRYQDIAPVVFHNRLVLLAVFGIFFWVHACHFHLHVAGWVRPLSHLSFHSLPGGACTSLVGLSVTLQGVSRPPLFHYSILGCVAATLVAVLIITVVCRCHPPCSHFAGCVAATPILC